MLKANPALLIFVQALCIGTATEACPTGGCICEEIKTGERVSCIGNEFVEIVSASSLPRNTTELYMSRNPISRVNTRVLGGHKYLILKKLDLSDNQITAIDKQAFVELGSLLRLNLSSNKLTKLDGEAFEGLENLKALSLAKNKLYFINKAAFQGLRSLKKLELTSNRLMGIPDGALDFTPRNSLQRVLLQDNPMICDCQLKWLLKKLQASLQAPGSCQYPLKLKRRKLSSLAKKDMICSGLELPKYLFTPGNEISFQGSEHTFTCQATWIDGTELKWYKDEELVTPSSHDKHVKITSVINDDEVTIRSTFHIQRLSASDSGFYVCNISRPGGYEHLGKSELHVIHPNSKVCKAESTQGDRGLLHWYDTVAGAIAYSPCPNGYWTPWRKNWVEGMARRSCSYYGEWSAVENGGCAYVIQVTQTLHDLNGTHVNQTTVESVSSQLLNISSRAKQFDNAMDIIYAADIVKKISTFLTCNEKLGYRMVKSISNMMNADSALLNEAQTKASACSSMIKELDNFSKHFSSTPQCKQKPRQQIFRAENIAVVILYIPDAFKFKGKTCHAKVKEQKLYAMSCIQSSNYTLSRSSEPTGVSIHLPQDLFLHSSWKQKVESMQFVTVSFQSTVFINNKLFPVLRHGGVTSGFQVTGSVVSAHLRGVQLTSLVHPMIIEFKNRVSENSELVSWNHSANGGLGAWVRTKGCNLLWSTSSLLTECYQLTGQRYFAIMMASNMASSVQKEGLTLEPIVYIGAGVCSFLILVTLITFLLFRELRYNRDDAAMLMNECLALVVVIIVFVTGINHVKNPLMCRAVGVLLHYFLLCCLLWVGCGGVCLMRHIRTAFQPEEYNPVLRYYMISWGIPLIICGITVAGNPDNYSTDGYCWLRPQPCLGAFIGPASLMLIVNLIILLRLNHRQKNKYVSSSGHSDRPVASGENESGQAHTEEESLGTELLSQHTEESAMPPHGDVVNYIRGSALVLFLIIINFTLGVIVIRFQEPRYLNLAVSCIYAVANMLLGLVIFLFHCYKKEKAIAFWKSSCRSQCCAKKKYLLEAEGGEPEDLVDETDKGTPVLNGGAGKCHAIIHGATKLDTGTSDAQSNVSLPSSAALTIDRVSFCVDKGEDEENAPVSDKHSCSSAPLPFSHSPEKLPNRPAGYRHSYCVAEGQEAPHPKVRTPLKRKAPPIAASENLTSDSLSNRAPSESAASERSCLRNTGREQNASCSASEASETDGRSSRRQRPPGPPSAERVSTPSKNHRSQPLPVVQEHVAANPNMQRREMLPSNVKCRAANQLQEHPSFAKNQVPQLVQAYPAGRNAYPKCVPQEQYSAPKYKLPYQAPLGQHQTPYSHQMRMPREQQVARVRPVPHDAPPNTAPIAPVEQHILHPSQVLRDRVLLKPDTAHTMPVQGQKITETSTVPLKQVPTGQHVLDNQATEVHHGQEMPAENPRKEDPHIKQPNNNQLHPNSSKSQAKKAIAAALPPKKVARVKPTPKQWEAQPSSRVATYVPVPHLKHHKSYSETSI